MIEMRKLQKLGKVELLELVRELTEELEEVRFKNEVLVKAGGKAEQEEKPPPGPGEMGQTLNLQPVETAMGQPPPMAGQATPPKPGWGSSSPENWAKPGPEASRGQPGTNPLSQPLQTPYSPPHPTAAAAPPQLSPTPPLRESNQVMLEELEGFRRSVREICEIAERTRQEMDGCMTRVELAMKHREEEARQMAEQAYGKSEDVLRTLQEYKRQTEETLAKMMETVTSLQRVIQ